MCGVAGFIAPKASPAWRARVAQNLLHEATSRGTNATGMAFVDQEKGLQVLKNGVTAREFTNSDEFKEISKLLPPIVMLHTRAATGGKDAAPSENKNNHPFWGKDSKIAMIHNGVVQDEKWRKTVGKPEGISKKFDFEGGTDSEVCLRMVETLFEQDGEAATMESAIADSMFNISGSYALVFLREAEPNKIWFARHGGGSPIVLALNEKTPYILFGSTEDIIEKAITNTRIVHNFFFDVTSPHLLMEDVEENQIITVELLSAEPYFKITTKTFVSCNEHSYNH